MRELHPAPDYIFDVDEAGFETRVLEASRERPILVDFWAEWCAPCRALTPVVEAVAGEYQGRLKVGKMNIDEQPKTPAQFAVRAIPTLLLFKGGKASIRAGGN